MEKERNSPNRFSNDDFERLRFFKNAHSSPFDIPFSDKPREAGSESDLQFRKTIDQANEYLRSMSRKLQKDTVTSHRILLSVINAIAFVLPRKEVVLFSKGLPVLYKGFALQFLASREARMKCKTAELLDLIVGINKDRECNDIPDKETALSYLKAVIKQSSGSMLADDSKAFNDAWTASWRSGAF